MVTEPEDAVHGVDSGALRRGTNREDNAAVPNGAWYDPSLELDTIRG